MDGIGTPAVGTPIQPRPVVPRDDAGATGTAPDSRPAGTASDPAAGPVGSAPSREGPELEELGGSGLSAPAPSGVDPEFWTLLTAEEREHFRLGRTLGPVTYTPADGRASPLPRGGRLDVRA